MAVGIRMNTSTRWRVVAGSLVATLALSAASCGNGQQSQPVKLDPKGVPFGLLAPATTTTAPAPETPKYPFVVYFEGPDGVVPVIRTSPTPPDPMAVREKLLEGPTNEEAEVRMRTALPKGAIGKVTDPVKNTVTVDLLAPFTQVIGTEQAIALAQIVMSLTLLHGVTKVRFMIDGEPVSVPRGNGTLTRGPVTRADYSGRGSGSG
jgi:spore germination protein GerM